MRIIVNVATGDRYQRGQKRLYEMLQHADETGLFFSELRPDWPSHFDVPYAFKPHAIAAARKRADVVLWLDAAMWPVNPLEPLWEHIEREGHYFPKNGWDTGQWCADSALEPLGITREESFKIPHPMACVMGFDFRNERTCQFFDEWLALAGEAFRGPWTNANGEASKDPRVKGHRHDQTAAGVVAHRLGMEMKAPTVYAGYREWIGKTNAELCRWWGIPEQPGTYDAADAVVLNVGCA